MSLNSLVSRTFIEAIRFVFIGGLCYGLALVVLVALVSGLNVHYLIANVIALLVAYPFGYWINRRFNFNSCKPMGAEVRRYVIGNVVTFISSLGAIALLVERWKIHYLIANLLVSIVQTAINFALARYWVFKRDDA